MAVGPTIGQIGCSKDSKEINALRRQVGLARQNSNGEDCKMIIRSMRPEEIDSVLILFEYYRSEAGIDDEIYDQDRVLQTVREYAIRHNLMFRLALQGQRPVGLVGGFLSPDPVERELAATIQFLYLIPEFNQPENYHQLIQEFESWAKDSGAGMVRAIDIGSNQQRLSKIYDQLGYDPIRVSIMNKEIQ